MISDLIAITGVALILVGLYWMYAPLAPIAGGLFACAVANEMAKAKK